MVRCICNHFDNLDLFGQERRRNAEIKLRELQQQLQQVMSVLVLTFLRLLSNLYAQVAKFKYLDLQMTLDKNHLEYSNRRLESALKCNDAHLIRLESHMVSSPRLSCARLHAACTVKSKAGQQPYV